MPENLPFPTPLRQRTAALIGLGKVYSYTWSNQAWAVHGLGDEEPVTRHVNELISAGIAAKAAPEVDGARVAVELTTAGRGWLANAIRDADRARETEAVQRQLPRQRDRRAL